MRRHSFLPLCVSIDFFETPIIHYLCPSNFGYVIVVGMCTPSGSIWKQKLVCKNVGDWGRVCLVWYSKIEGGLWSAWKEGTFPFLYRFKIVWPFQLIKDELEHFLAIFTPLWHKIKVRSSTYPSLIGLKWGGLRELIRLPGWPWIIIGVLQDGNYISINPGVYLHSRRKKQCKWNSDVLNISIRK